MDLGDLKERVGQAKAMMEAPPPPGGSKPVLPIDAYLSDDAMDLVWKAVGAIRKEYSETHNLMPQPVLAGMIVDQLASSDETPTLGEVAAAIQTLAKSEGPWLVSTPLCHIALPDAVVPINETALLRRAVLTREWLKERFADDEDGTDNEFAVHRHFGDRVTRPTRWFEFRDDAIDTGRSAQLLTVEEGAIGLALPRAQAKARYAIAVWTIMSPPTGQQLLPDLGIWVPQPYLEWRPQYKRREQEAWIAKERVRGGGIFEHGDYEAPDAKTLRLPFEAVAVVGERRSAQALLSASWALFQAARASRSQVSEQLRDIRVAIETLCEPRRRGSTGKRWNRLAARLRVWEQLSYRGYDIEEVQAAQDRLRLARNIATHGADAVLLDVGYPPTATRHMRRGPPAEGKHLAYPALRADLSPLVFAVRFVLRELFKTMRDATWDDAAFEKQFR